MDLDRCEVRPLSKKESFFFVANQHGTLIPTYKLDLETTGPLTHDVITKTFRDWCRLFQPLRLQVGTNENGGLSFYETKEIIFDLKVVDVTSDLPSMQGNFEQLGKEPFNELTSLWKARLYNYSITDSSSKDSSIQVHKLPSGCVKFDCTLLLSFSHSITDGFSSLFMIDGFQTILNNAIADLPNENINEYSFGKPMESTTYFKDVVTRLSQNKNALNISMDIHKSVILSNIPLYSEYNDTQNGPPDTLVVKHVFNPEQTSIFVRLCKQENVTVHSALTALINIGFLDCIEDNETNYKTDIISGQIENLRKYYSIDEQKVLGYNVSNGYLSIVVPGTSLKEFWNYARLVNEKLKETYLSGSLIEYEIAKYHLTLEQKVPPTSFDDSVKPFLHYGISNMGDISAIVKNKESQVIITEIERYCSLHDTMYPLSFFLQTFEGRMVYTLAYNTAFVGKDLVLKLVNIIDIIFSKLISK